MILNTNARSKAPRYRRPDWSRLELPDAAGARRSIVVATVALLLPACVSSGPGAPDPGTGGHHAPGSGGEVISGRANGTGGTHDSAAVLGSGGAPGFPGAQVTGGRTAMNGAGGASFAPSGNQIPSTTSFDTAGPYKTTTVNNTGPDGTFTLFRPTELGQGGVRHPIITWGNGTGTTPVIYSAFLTHLASHGFVVIASNSANTGTGTEMLAGVQWLVDQNAGAGDFADKLDPTKVGAIGHSQGGGGALNAGADSRVTTVVPIAPAPGSGSLKGTMALLCGGQDTIISATTLCTSLIYNRASVPTFFGILKAATHTTAIGNIGGYRAPATAWLRLQLMGDEAARPMFYGPSCTLCMDPNWTVTSKNL